MSLGTLLQLMDPLAIQRREDSYKDADRGRRASTFCFTPHWNILPSSSFEGPSTRPVDFIHDFLGS
jgi:hypothetical protein